MEEVSNISNAVIMICLICREVDYEGRKTKKVASKLLRNHSSFVWDIFLGPRGTFFWDERADFFTFFQAARCSRQPAVGRVTTVFYRTDKPLSFLRKTEENERRLNILNY